ncbi:PREDICTED: prolyl 3-hydroxylase 2-like isoform X1 [Acromyrmex echinatior]|uniref:prolyl 3-hydroxylase 2-like isoform X1 n=1 Tax=Acromyrmex echinatior TaxID=103372 RepID=UPI000580E5D2|nr:PREDICTED: prolyl 3-hydroxylase 2-like isoform X1 [Acromyrmex echinatior]
MRFVLLVVLLGACACHARNDEIEINEIDNDESVAREEQRVRNITLAEIFENAVQAYLEEDWDGCVAGFNDALHEYKAYKRLVIICRRKCKAEAAGSSPIFMENIEDLHFYERKVKETLCLMKCNQDYREIAGEGALKRLPHATEKKFVDFTIYEYLHICYFQKERYQDAANAAFTFLSLHPNHEMTKKNLKHYLNLSNVTVEKVVNLEAAPFVQKYIRGVKAYEDEYYAEAVIEFENSLELYIESEEECRIYCEGPFNQGWYPEFTSSVANHFTFCLKCKRGCSLALNNVNGDFRSDLLRSHYNYLQFAYYKLGNLKAACAAVASYLLFLPADEAMLHNKDYYSSQPKIKEQYFTPREEALSYVKRQEYELLLINYIAVEFAAIDVRFNKFKKINMKKADKEELGKDFSSKPILHPPPGHSPSIRTRFVGNLSSFRDKEETEIREERVMEQLKVTNNTRLIAEESELGGRNRYMADGFLNSTDCNLLMQLAQIAVEGDGYEENKSPHSSYERFEGVTIGRIALMVYFGLTKPELLKLFLQHTEEARNHVERYFNLDRPLYFTYTHLVCRTALLDSPANRTDLSHEIHADNCVIKDDGSCLREDPAYTWRDYSAILYLNDDFDGGEFFFVEDWKRRRVQGIVRPRCGRMVAFSAGGENLHGVQGVRSGKRCAVALWFTQDEKYLEYERVVANTVLQRVHTLGTVQREDTQIPLKYEDTLIQCFKEDEMLRQILREFTREGTKN